MAILGVLLGITMTVLGIVAFIGLRDLSTSYEAHTELEARVAILEKRKALLAEAVTSQPKPAGVGATKLRTWNEDAPIVEVNR